MFNQKSFKNLMRSSFRRYLFTYFLQKERVMQHLMTLPLESSDLEFVLLGGKVLSQEWMTHFVNVYKHHYLVLICCFWKINSARKPHFYDFFPEMMIVNKKKMHTFRNLYATSDISFSKKDFWKIIFFLRCVMRYSSSFLRFGNRPNDFRTLELSVKKLRFLK